MQIVTATENQFSLIEAFLAPYEYYCVQLAAIIRKKTEKIEVLVKNDSLEKGDDILGLFYFDKILLHCLPFAIKKAKGIICLPDFRPPEFELSDFEALIANYFEGSNVRCISGEKNSTDLFLKIFKNLQLEPYYTNTYKLMTLYNQPFEPPEPLSCDDEIRRCYTQDYDSLFDLQKKYIIKEVAPAGKQVSDAECAISLKKILKEQLCFALFSDEEVVAKANTNAIGINWVQIGGVYTHPLYRRNYYAWNLVRAVCQGILKTNRKVCLYVKEKNNPAHILYQHIGFSESGMYEICYFN